jgi:hypothetical protein
MMKRRPPPPPPPPPETYQDRARGFTLWDLRQHTKMNGYSLRSCIDEAGVTLRPYVRNDAVVSNRVYKTYYDCLTPEETARVLAVWYRRKGRAYLKKLKLDQVSLGELVARGRD